MKRFHADGLPFRTVGADAGPAAGSLNPVAAADMSRFDPPSLPAHPTHSNPVLATLHDEILEAIASGLSFAAIATLLCRRAEIIAPTAICTILAIDADRRLRPIAAPSLPASFSNALDGVQIGADVGSCGAAAFLGHAVQVMDIASDPLWVSFRHLALPLGLAACWSSPVVDRCGRVIATFAFYYRNPRGPSDVERMLVRTCVKLLLIAFEQAAMLESNRRLSHYDRLTGLPNRLSFDELLNRRLLDLHPNFGLIRLDIDELRTINDTRGYRVGDAVVREMARRIASAGDKLSAFHLLGDEFAVIVDPCADRADLVQASHILLQAINLPAGDAELPAFGATLGGVVYGLDGIHAETLRRNADIALKRGKTTNRGGFLAFDLDRHAATDYGEKTIADVRLALVEGRMKTYYQPVVRLENGAIVGVEALARMIMPDGTVIQAGAFQSALTDPAVGYRVTDRMLQYVARDIRTWLDAGIDFGHVGINLSPADFRRADIEQRLVDAFAVANVPLKHLVVEVTESVFMEAADLDLVGVAQRIRDRGALIALDDFGTGFASLTHLLRLPVDILKIDRSFVDRLISDRPSEIIVETLIEMAGKLGMRVVAEGIETCEQAERLLALGCRLGQGYHFGRAEDFTTTLRRFEDSAQHKSSMARRASPNGGSAARTESASQRS